jgi:hypothetical protein
MSDNQCTITTYGCVYARTDTHAPYYDTHALLRYGMAAARPSNLNSIFVL